MMFFLSHLSALESVFTFIHTLQGTNTVLEVSVESSIILLLYRATNPCQLIQRTMRIRLYWCWAEVSTPDPFTETSFPGLRHFQCCEERGGPGIFTRA